MQISKSQQYIWFLKHKVGLPITVTIVFLLASTLIYFSFIQPSKAHLAELTERAKTGFASTSKLPHSAPLIQPQDEL
ncbi:MAG: hypothetical protein U1E13_13550, partial [Methylophilaceae bacterium]|nr:hypothetical protein [Methylophilaceae bacterium]